MHSDVIANKSHNQQWNQKLGEKQLIRRIKIYKIKFPTIKISKSKTSYACYEGLAEITYNIIRYFYNNDNQHSIFDHSNNQLKFFNQLLIM